ncbi:MAG: DUF4832 domain-containing protein [Bryobacteraceae bacterium]
MPIRIALLAAVVAAVASAQPTVIARPKMIDDVLVNPNMGIQTFQRYNHQTLFEGTRWSEVGPEAAVADAPGPVDFPASSVAYLRWFWYQLEPERGHYRWEILDTALEEARKHNQALAIRLMPYDQSSPLPEWYRNSGARRANKPSDADGKIWSPDASDPLYISAWSALVREAGKRYDGHPYLDSVDISTAGYWGEGWGPYLPEWPIHKALIDVYFEAFPRTPLLMNFDQLDALAYALSRGAGWRLDCWGDMGRPGHPNWAHMFDLYPEQVARAGAQEVWRHAPVSLEACGVPGTWKKWGFELKPIFDQALRWHVSTVNIKSTAIPPEWKAAFEEFQKQMGYRFALRRFEHPAQARAGTMAPISMWWFNAGVAPVYREYQLALELRSAGHAARTVLPVDVRKWLPGDSVYESTVYVDDALPPGNYRVRVALLDPRTGLPAVRLAIEGRQNDGWYDVSGIEIR